MKRPEVTVDNHEEMQNFFTEHGPSLRFMQGFHGVMGAIFHPRVAYVPDTREVVEEHLGAGKPAILSLAHTTWWDPSVYAALIQHQRPFKPAIGNVVTAANGPLFNTKVLGWIITTGGAIPAFRDKDVEAYESRPDAKHLKGKANAVMIDIAAANLDRGRNVAIFPESTRGAKTDRDRTQIQRLKYGIVRIVNKTERPEDVLIVFMSGYYGERKVKNVIHGAVGLGHLALQNAAELTIEDIKAGQQSAMDLAVDTYHNSK